MKIPYVTSTYNPDNLKINKVGLTLILGTNDHEFSVSYPTTVDQICESIEDGKEDGWFFHALYMNGKPMKFEISTLLTKMEEM